MAMGRKHTDTIETKDAKDAAVGRECTTESALVLGQRHGAAAGARHLGGTIADAHHRAGPAVAQGAVQIPRGDAKDPAGCFRGCQRM